MKIVRNYLICFIALIVLFPTQVVFGDEGDGDIDFDALSFDAFFFAIL